MHPDNPLRYTFKPIPEFMWSVVIAGAVVLFTSLAGLTENTLNDPRTWAISLGVAMTRAMAGAALDVVRQMMTAAGDRDA